MYLGFGLVILYLLISSEEHHLFQGLLTYGLRLEAVVTGTSAVSCKWVKKIDWRFPRLVHIAWLRYSLQRFAV